MNKQERMIAVLLGLALAGWVFYSNKLVVRQAREAQSHPQQAAAVATATNTVSRAATLSAATDAAQQDQAALPSAVQINPDVPEETITLNGGDTTLLVSSYGAVIKRVTLNRYTAEPGPASEKNPAVTLDFAEAPGLELTGVPGLPSNVPYSVERGPDGKVVTLTVVSADGLKVCRRIELKENYQLKVTDTLSNTAASVLALGTNGVSLGMMRRGVSKNDLLSVDSLPAADRAKVRYGDKDKALKRLVGGGASGGFGCGGAPSAAGMADHTLVPVMEPQRWVALKSRFFVMGFMSDEPNCGFAVSLSRDLTKTTYALDRISARMLFDGRVLASGEKVSRDYLLYVGPKKLSLLQALDNGMDAVMEFGTFTWFCKLLVPTLNFFYKIIPNYGVAIILLTFLVRVIFWPLTHKSTQSMKKMQEIQPKLKELQKQFKDNPQKLQQETWAIYRENKVNPMSSCLPMLVQIPVFIALFTVLRSAVELRYAPFLWIADLSEPENLLAGVLPIPLNILPILMSATMAIQSYLTPSAGDPQQQKMMMVMMPVMMLFMFYSFPSALSLYWTVSQVVSIVQMLMMRKKSAMHQAEASGGSGGGLTRQQRRHGHA